jgi:hypothetical protein
VWKVPERGLGTRLGRDGRSGGVDGAGRLSLVLMGKRPLLKSVAFMALLCIPP